MKKTIIDRLNGITDVVSIRKTMQALLLDFKNDDKLYEMIDPLYDIKIEQSHYDYKQDMEICKYIIRDKTNAEKRIKKRIAYTGDIIGTDGTNISIYTQEEFLKWFEIVPSVQIEGGTNGK